MKSFYKTTSFLLVILGVIHTSLTPLFYKTFSVDALWFAGTGLSLVFLGLLNIAALKTSIKSVYQICIFANIICTIYFAIIVIVLPEPQAFIGVLFIVSVLIGSIVVQRKLRSVN
ncbi:hypothetical protein JW964_19940 [candidate division KSB1 bacterium]|nr:hypothetical protein [candidate division KSB1 bacterium]